MQRIMVALVPAALFLACDLEEIEHDPLSEAEETFAVRLAEAYCSALFACDPVSTCGESPIPYASEAECLDREQAALDQVGATARNAGMTFDGECVDRSIAQYAEVGCDGFVRLGKRFATTYDVVRCQPYFGPVPEGEDPCFDVVDTELSTCGANLQCVDETCVVDGYDDSCDCAEGSMCAYYEPFNDGCLPILAVGDVCSSPNGNIGVCPLDSYCDFELDEQNMPVSGVCVAATPLGGACSSGRECASYACGAGVCVSGDAWLCDDDVAPRRFR